MKPLAVALMISACAVCQTKSMPETKPIEYQVCVEPIAAYGGHVRFSTEDHLALLLHLRRTREQQHGPYRRWEMASRELDWFSGPKPVSLDYVKRHMPRAMLLELRFPVDQNPHIDPVGLKALLDAEAAYEKTTKGTQDFPLLLLKKYNVGPGAVYDEDMGGFTAIAGCARWETQKMADSK